MRTRGLHGHDDDLGVDSSLGSTMGVCQGHLDRSASWPELLPYRAGYPWEVDRRTCKRCGRQPLSDTCPDRPCSSHYPAPHSRRHRKPLLLLRRHVPIFRRAPVCLPILQRATRQTHGEAARYPRTRCGCRCIGSDTDGAGGVARAPLAASHRCDCTRHGSASAGGGPGSPWTAERTPSGNGCSPGGGRTRSSDRTPTSRRRRS